MSGLFRGSQLNWAALTEEAYAIYMSIRKLTFYVTGSDITVKSDHLPLKKFLEKQTMNAKVNNWAVELEQFKIKMEWIQGAKNTLADSLSRLLEMTPEAELEKEPDGQEFGTACFKDMETVQTHIVYIESVETLLVTAPPEAFQEVSLPLKPAQMVKLQKADAECRDIVRKLRNNKNIERIYILEDGCLKCLWIEDHQTFKCTVIPKILRDPLLVLAHDKNGHNGSQRSYMALK